MFDPMTSITAAARRARALATLALMTCILALAATPAIAMGGAPSPYRPPAGEGASGGPALVATLVLLGTLATLALVVSRVRRTRPAPPPPQQRWTGAAAVVGGAALIAFATLAAGEPQGCVGDECLVRSHRDLGGLNSLLTVGGLLILCGYAGMADLVRRSALLRTASILLAGGLGWAVIGLTVDGDWAWYAFAIPAMLAWVVGFAVAGVGVVRTSVAPAWLGAALTVASLALLGANDQDARVLLLVPFGATWILLGSVLVGGRIPATTKLEANLRRA